MAHDKNEVRSILGVSEQDCEALLKSAADTYVDGDLKDAETQLRGLIALTDDPRPVKLLASVLFQLGRHDEAAAAYEAARACDPNDLFVLAALGELRLKTLRTGEAVPLLQKVLELDPQAAHPAGNRVRLLLQEYCEQLEREGHKV